MTDARGRGPAQSTDAGIPRWQAWARIASAALFIPFGVLHILAAPKFLPIMPPAIPFPHAVIVLTGISEILGGIGILLPPVRKAAAIGLALYAVGVYPANVYQALWHVRVPPLPDSWWYHAPRLAFQPVFVWWALFAGGLIAWPFRRRGEIKRPLPSVPPLS